MASLLAGAPRLSLSRHRSRQDSLRALPIATIEVWSPTHPTGQDPKQVPEPVAFGERQLSTSSSANSHTPTLGWRMRTLPLPSAPDTTQQANNAQLTARLRGPMPGAQLPVAAAVASANEEQQQQRQGRPRASALSLAATALVFLPLLQVHTHGEHISRGLVATVAYVAAAAGALSHAIASVAASATAAYTPPSASPQLLATVGAAAEVALTDSGSSGAAGSSSSSGGGGDAGGKSIGFVEGVRRAASRAFAAALLPLPYEVFLQVSAAAATLLPLLLAGATSLVHSAYGVVSSWSAWRAASAPSEAAAAATAAAAAATAAGPMHAGAAAAASSWGAAAAWACTALLYGTALLLPSPTLGGLTRGSFATKTGRKGPSGAVGFLMLTAARGVLLWMAWAALGGVVEQRSAALGAWLGAAWAVACAGVWGLHCVGLLASVASAVW